MCFIVQMMETIRISHVCVDRAALGLCVGQLSQVGVVKEVPQEALHPGGLGPRSIRDQRRVQTQVQVLSWAEGGGAGLGGVEPLDGARQPDEPLQTLDVSAAVVQQLVFAHSSAAARRRGRDQSVGISSVHKSLISQWSICETRGRKQNTRTRLKHWIYDTDTIWKFQWKLSMWKKHQINIKDDSGSLCLQKIISSWLLHLMKI